MKIVSDFLFNCAQKWVLKNSFVLFFRFPYRLYQLNQVFAMKSINFSVKLNWLLIRILKKTHNIFDKSVTLHKWMVKNENRKWQFFL